MTPDLQAAAERGYPILQAVIDTLNEHMADITEPAHRLLIESTIIQCLIDMFDGIEDHEVDCRLGDVGELTLEHLSEIRLKSAS